MTIVWDTISILHKNEFIFYFRISLLSRSVQRSYWSAKLAQAKYVTPAFNSKGKHEKLAVVVRVLQNTQNFVISRCCFAEDG